MDGTTFDDNVYNVNDPVANPGWQGNRAVHNFYYGFDFDGLEPPSRTLRVMTTIEGVADRYLLEFSMYRGQRSLIHIVRFDIAGVVTADDLLEAAYIPLAIVYCPPGQDMTNSLKEVETHGTRFTFGDSRLTAVGESEGTGALLQGQYSFVGIKASVDDSVSDSQVLSDGSTSTVRLTKTHETTITANNQRAIGRALWGPLGDVFVILKDMLFHVAEVFHEDSGYTIVPLSNSPRARKLLVSTYELLRPPPGSAAAEISWEQRKRILALNPFVVRDEALLDRIANGTLEPDKAVNSSLDPNTEVNPTRAVPVLRCTPGAGSELTFYESTGIIVERTETHAERYTTQFRSATDIGVTIGLPLIGMGLNADFSESQTIEYQTTAEMEQDTTLIKAAYCYLIRNQNDPNIGPIDVYYDTVFGTFMFRTDSDDGPCSGTKVSGIVMTKKKLPLANAKVVLHSSEKKIVRSTLTNSKGYFWFPCLLLDPGKYILVTGGTTQAFEVSDKDRRQDVWVGVNDAKQPIRLDRGRIGDIAEVFSVSKTLTCRRRGRLLDAVSLSDMCTELGIEAVPERLERLFVLAPKEPEDHKRYPSNLRKALAAACKKQRQMKTEDSQAKPLLRRLAVTVRGNVRGTVLANQLITL